MKVGKGRRQETRLETTAITQGRADGGLNPSGSRGAEGKWTDSGHIFNPNTHS